MKAKDVMNSNVVSVQPTATIAQAIRLMLQKKISGLPVVNDAGGLVGIVTEGDFLRRAETQTEKRRPRWLEFLLGPGRLADEYVHSHGRKVEEIMTPGPVTVTEDTPLDEVVKTMEKRRVKRVPVMRGQQVVGIVSRANLLHALVSVVRDVKSPEIGDAAIREKLVAELQKQTWAPIGALDIIVRNGIVELWGAIMDERERQALVVAAENIPGVKGVRDHLAWVDATSGMVFYSSANEATEAKAS